MITIIQNGKIGDIVRVLPAAKYLHDAGHEVFWCCDKKYHAMFDYVDYVKPVEKPVFGSTVIDINFGINQKTSLHREWLRKRPTIDSFLTMKYEMLCVPISEVSNLVYNRNFEKERQLFERVCPNDSYILIHSGSDYGTPITEIDYPDYANQVFFKPVEGFTIFDWRLVIENASEIHCIDSSLVNFVDCLPNIKGSLNYYITDKVPMKGDRTMLTKNWNTVNKLEYANS